MRREFHHWHRTERGIFGGMKAGYVEKAEDWRIIKYLTARMKETRRRGRLMKRWFESVGKKKTKTSST